MNTHSSAVIKEIRRDTDATVVVLSGEVDLQHSPQLHATLVDIAAGRPKRLILNLSQVNYMDSSGVGTLVELLRRVNAYKGKLALVGMTERVRSVFEVTKLDRFFSIHPSEEEAARA
jgi:anti-sigma B factor antagonist